MADCFHGDIVLEENVTDLYPVKVPDDFCGGSVYVGFIAWPPNTIVDERPEKPDQEVKNVYGIEAKLMNMLAERFNFTPRYYCFGVEDNWGEVLGYEFGTGMIGALTHSKVDVIFGSMILSSRRNKYLDASVDYLQVVHKVWFVIDSV